MLLLVCTLLQTFGTSTVNADSNDRRSAFLDLMTGKNVTTSDFIKELTSDDLRCIALYLSNFYIPFGTSLDGNSADANKEVMIDTLTGIGFDKDTASSLIDTVYQASLDSATPLYSYYPESVSKTYVLSGTASVTSDYMWELNCSRHPGQYMELNQEDLDDINNNIISVGDTVNSDVVCNSCASDWLYCMAAYLAGTTPVTTYSTTLVEKTDAIAAQDVSLKGWFQSNNNGEVTFGTTLSTFSNPNYISYTGEPIDASCSCNDSSTTCTHTYVPATLWTWTMDAKWEDGSTTGGTELDGSSWCSGYYYQKPDGTMEKVFQWDHKSVDMYLSMLTKQSGSTYSVRSDWETGGFGNAIVNVPIGKESSYNVDTDTLASLSIFTQKIYVDWVGNIIADYGTERVVIYPACANTLAFNKIDGTGHETKFNFISTWGMRFINGFVKEDSNGKLNAEPSSTDNWSLMMKLKMSLGNKDDVTWDSNLDWFKTESGTAGAIANTYREWGIRVQEGDNNPTKVCNINWSNYYDITPEKAMDTLVVYANIVNSDIETVGSSSSFAPVNILEDISSISNCFTSGSKFSKADNSFGSIMSFMSEDKAMLSNIFLTYAIAYSNKDATSFDKATNWIDMKFMANKFPAVTGKIQWVTRDTTEDAIKSFIYYLLHPTEGISYVSTWVKNKVGGIFLGMHEDMVGATSSNSTTGMTAYLGFTGYATSPSLSEIEWVSKLLDNYNNLIVFLIIFMSLILLCYVLVGNLSLQRGILGLLIFSLFAFIPPVAINSTVNTINTTCDSIYSSKFDFWALCQIETYLGKLSTIKKAGTSGDYLNALLSLGDYGSIDTSNSFSGTRVKWMCPKKISAAAEASDALSNKFEGTGLSSTLSEMIMRSQSSATSVEEYTSDGSLFLYRDIGDIYLCSSVSYNTYNYFDFNGTLANTSSCKLSSPGNTDSSNGVYNWIGNQAIKSLSYSSGEIYKNYIFVNNQNFNDGSGNTYNNIKQYIQETSSIKAIDRGFLVNTINPSYPSVDNNGFNYYSTSSLATSLLVNYNATVNDMYAFRDTLLSYVNGSANMNLSASNMYYSQSSLFVPINSSYFEFSTNDIIDNKGISTTSDTYKNLSSYYYSLYSESPFYYFSYNIRDTYKAVVNSYCYSYQNLEAGTNFTDLFLKNNQEYFFNYAQNSGDGYGELRDFMNFHDFFYYILPMLQVGNDMVIMFDEVYGMSTYEDCSLSISSTGKITYDGQTYDNLGEILHNFKTLNSDGDSSNDITDEELYKFWHDYNVWCLWNCYTPWLDTMTDCNYAKPETITVLGDKFIVQNPLDPTSYFETDGTEITAGRYMVFSRSEMAYYNLDMSDLTEVERKIIEVQDNVYEKSIRLMNYNTLHDETLINAYSMIQLFEFNKTFSQQGFIGEGYVLYPQGYELKAFTYDAYMRLILSESSGDSLMTDENTSIYERIMGKTSILFGVLLVANDIIAVYLIPMLKLAFLLLIFFISIALIISASIKLEFNVVTVMWKSILAPLCSYAITCIGMAYIVSLFMSNGAEGVTDSGVTISLGDPTMAVIAMIIINVVVLVLYWKICKKCYQDFKTYVTAICDNIGAAIAGAFKQVTSTIANGKDGFRRFRTNNRARRDSKNLAALAGTAQQRGFNNSPKSGKNGIGFGRMMASAATMGAVAGAVNNATDGTKGMSKYDIKAMNKAKAKANAQQSGIDKLQHKVDMANANGNTAKAARLQGQLNKAQAKQARSTNLANDIKTKGRFGAYRGRMADDLKTAKANAQKGINFAKNTAKDGKAFVTKTSKNIGTSAKNIAIKTKAGAKDFTNKSKAGMTKLGNDIKSGQFGVNVYDKLASGVNATVNTGRRVGKGIERGKLAVKNTAEGVAYKVKDTAETGAIHAMLAADKVRDTSRNIGRGAVKAAKFVTSGEAMNTVKRSAKGAVNKVKDTTETHVLHAMLASDKVKAGVKEGKRLAAKNMSMGREHYKKAREYNKLAIV